MTKTKSTKRALLLSALALLLCVSMLIGSTYAWFTDSVTSGSNVIQSGTLDIVMEYWDGDSWEDAAGQVLEFVKGGNYHGYTGEVLWEPGCTYELPAIRVRNEGNLAAKVLLKVNGVTGDEKLLEAIDFTTKVKNVPDSLKTGSAASVFAAMEGSSYPLWYGTADGTVMMDWSLMAKGHTSLNTGHTDTSAEFTISGHMKEEAGNEYQGLKIEGVSITALATQEVYEYDSFGREYDKNAPFPTVVATAADLKAALANGGEIELGTDIVVNDSITVPAGVEAVLNLNGNDITSTKEVDAANGTTADVFKIENGAKLTVNGDGNVTMTTNIVNNTNVSVAIFRNAGELVINGGNYMANDASVPTPGAMIIVTIVDTCLYSGDAVTTINGGEFNLEGGAINLFRNFPTHNVNVSTKLVINDGTFNANPAKTTYIWNHQNGASYVSEMVFNGGTYNGIVYEDYYGQSDVTVGAAAIAGGLQAYSGNN